MDTNRIRYFLSLAKTGSVTKAAELHHISPAAFSKAMNVLAEEFNVKLTVPSGRGVILTDNAKELIPVFTEVIEKLDAVKKDRNSGSGSSEKKVVRIATFEVFSTHFIERLLDQSFFDYECQLYEMIPGQMEAAVASRVVDIALTYIPIPHPDLDFIKISPIEMGVYGNISGRSNESFHDLPFVVPVIPVEGSPNKVRGLDGWPDDALPRNIRYRVQMLETALGLCRRGIAVAYIPKFIARLHNETVKPQFALKEFEQSAKFRKNRDYVYLVKRKSDTEGTEVKKISMMIRKYCAEK
ncbi:MAG: LysR family transcriptional regulator [Pseudobdellovibrionaceae bacterium]